MRIIPLFLSMLLFVTTISAQRNYVPAVITNLQGDSLRGFIDYRNWNVAPSEISFKTSLSDDKVQHFGPGDIRAFRIAEPDETNVSRQIRMDVTRQDIQGLTAPVERVFQDTLVFIRVLVTGTYNLYVYTDKNARTHYIYEASGKPESATDLEHVVAFVSNSSTGGIYEGKTYQQQLSTLFADFPSVAKRASHVAYRENNLVNLFEEYNHSKVGNAKEPFVKKKEKAGVLFGVMAGASFNSYKFSGPSNIFDGSSYNSSTSPIIGVFLDVPFGRNRGQFVLHNELFYKEVKADGTARDKSPVNLDFSYLQISTMFRYVYPKGVIRPFGDIGMGNSFVISTKENKIVRTSGSGRPVDAIDGPRKLEQSILIGLGVLVHKLSFEARYAGSNGMSGMVNNSVTIDSYQLIAGYRF